MKSIRTRLLAWLLTLFAITWVAITSLTYLESSHEVEELFDAALAQSAGVLAQITAAESTAHSTIPHELARDVYGHPYEKKIAFQIWLNGELVLRSASAPTTPLSSVEGFSDQRVGDATWRVFFLTHTGDGRQILVGERYDVRNELISEITQASLYPLIVALPLLVLLIWLGLGRGLTPLRRVTSAVEQRSPRNLEPMSEGDSVPDEIRPIVHALNNLFERLSAAFERERQFTADAAHELRTPLASLKTQAQVALRATKEDQRLHALRNVSAGVDRTTHLVEQLLTLARLDPDEFSEHTERVDLHHLAEEVLAELGGTALEKNIELSLGEAHGCAIEGHRTGLRLLLRNLIENAIRYTPEGGSVDAEVRTSGNGVIVAVTDSGPGIPPQERKEVFRRFYRGTQEGGPYGSGLGLSIVQRVAQLHGASVNLEDGPGGQGLKISVRFPQR